MLLKVFNRTRLLQRIQNCRDNIIRVKLDEKIHSDYNYHELTFQAIYEISLYQNSDNKEPWYFEFDGKNIEIKAGESINNLQNLISNIGLVNEKREPLGYRPEFNEEDFYTIILDLIKLVRI